MENKTLIPQLEIDNEHIANIKMLRKLKAYQLRPELKAESFIENGQKIGVGFRVFWDNAQAKVKMSGGDDGWIHFSASKTLGTYVSISWNLEFELLDSLRQKDILSIAIDDYDIKTSHSSSAMSMAYLNVEKGNQSERFSQHLEYFGGRHVASFSIRENYDFYVTAHAAWIDMIFSGEAVKSISIKNPFIYSQTHVL